MFLYFLVIISFLSLPIYTFFRVVRSFLKGTESTKEVKVRKLDIITFFMIYFLLFIGFFINSNNLAAGERLRIYSLTGRATNEYASLANEHMLTIMALLLLGIISYWLISIYGAELSPIVYVVCSSILILNILFTIIYMTHTGFSHYEGTPFTNGILFLQMGYTSISFLYIATLKESLDNFMESRQEKLVEYNHKGLKFT